MEQSEFSRIPIPKDFSPPHGFRFEFDFTPGLDPLKRRSLVREKDGAIAFVQFIDGAESPSLEDLNAHFPAALDSPEAPPAEFN